MRQRGNRYGEGTFLESKLFLSPAFLSLGSRGSSPVVSNCSTQVLILLLGKRTFGYRKKNGKKVLERTDGNKISLTYKELEARGISQKRTTRSIDELLAKGFIKIVNPGGLFEKDKALYALVEDYRMWRRGCQPISTRQRDVRRGYQGRKSEQQIGGERIHFAVVNGGHPHGCQRGAPHENTRSSAGGTL